jgi:uncharacterized protein
MSATSAPGSVGWLDLTVKDPGPLLGFYQRVLGWTVEPVPMNDALGAYDDYLLKDSAGAPVGGLCHGRGNNQGLPPVWLTYVRVADMTAALAAVQQGGGQVLNGPRGAGGGQMAVIRDPAGAILALYQG